MTDEYCLYCKQVYLCENIEHSMDPQLTPDQSLRIIQDMVLQAKKSFHRFSYYFLLWGVLLTVATLVEYAAAVQGWPHGWAIWPLMGVLGGLLSARYGARESRRQGVETFTDRVVLAIWLAYMVTLVLVIVCSVLVDRTPGPWVTILTGLPTFATGRIIRFMPLVLGGVGFWVIGAASCFTTGTTGALLFALAMVVGYIVPGFMLRRQEDGVRTS